MSRTKPFRRILAPFQEFAALESSGGVLLLFATVASLVVVNSGYSGQYTAWLRTTSVVSFAALSESNTTLGWINDGLMALFFLVVGLEIKREFASSDLANPRQARLPFVAALGGMVVPAVIYALLNWGQSTVRGWGVPMATDIAFALGILSLLGPRVPNGLKVFLAALAIIDDIGAVAVIALFYSQGLHVNALLGALACFVVMALGSRLGVRNLLFYSVTGIVMWWFVHHSGIHATVAGVLMALCVPVKPKNEEDEESTPLQRMLHGLHPWVVFGIVPLFAFANAGVRLGPTALSSLATSPASLGTVLGLFVGKPLGIVLFSYVAIRLKVASVPPHCRKAHLIGTGLLAGIGFTMAIFIASLAFPEQQALDGAKTAVLLASTASGLAGFAVLWSVTRRTDGHPASLT